ncbi:SpoIIE family protein phosphatase [Flammeovirga sp. SubArs3]|uniref:ATP-binding SpoIIE family protein phosphatase n=1 Tax=Flammeovirga sp. SubArs3 TaxID=2995316 RepID=UPI00248AB946|nr:SpoIIE family protein phosphatase [Flammeovirga sp. SubArs3]
MSRILGNDHVHAVKIATIISSYLRSLLNNHDLLMLKSSYSMNNNHGRAFHIEITDPSTPITTMPPPIDVHFFRIAMNSGRIIMNIVREFPLGALNSIAEIFNEKSRDELLDELKVKNQDLEMSYHNLKKAKDDNARMESELSVGRNIQMSMLPKNFLKNDYVSLFADLIPAREVGGDFYDFQLINGNYLYIVVGDVSDKGVPAALLMAMTKSLLKSAAMTELSTAKIITHVNNQIVSENKNNMFVTIFLGMLDLKSGELTYTNAGHNPSIVIKENGITKLTERHGPIVGAIRGLSYKEKTIQLSPNDVIFAYTDGVTEARNGHKEFYTDEKLDDFCRNVEIDSVKGLVEKTIESVREFEDGHEQADDITVMCVKYKDTMPPTFEKRIGKSLNDKILITNELNQFIEQNNIPENVGQKVQIILDELLSNMVKYAFDKVRQPDIKIKIIQEDNQLRIKISDNGIEFNPFILETPNTQLPLEEREQGGLGVHIVKSLANEYVYERSQDRNEITLIKTFTD